MPRLISCSAALVLLLGACGNEEPEVQIPPGSDTNITADDPERAEEAVSEPASEGEATTVDPYDYLMPDGSTASFLGEGIEYANFTLRTVYLEGEHVAVYENNGGTVALRVYRLSEDAIELVEEQVEFYEDYTATREELEALEPIRTYLTFPLESGMVIGERTVVETETTVETPYKNFEQVVVLESKGEQDSLSRSYFAEGYGEIKREYRMQEEGQEEFVVTSVLEELETE
ncbi:hypothetical protein [uncultured Planococcus sp.]|uniref:hypothetical protein n=1 Tax=Planococcus donghaensis TaxID=414778 RepID=UPI0026083589|nr:hypothetical protein [uncultured Planococcus sp.]